MSEVRYSGVLWDLDGTIADSVPLIRESLRHAVREVLGHEPDHDTLMRNIFLPLADQMRAFDPQRVDELCAEYLRWNHAVSKDRLKAHPQMIDVVRELSHAGVPQGIASSKSRAGVALALRILNIENVFTSVISVDDVPLHKPDPTPLRIAFQQMGVAPGDGCYIGDALTDIAAAKAVGTPAIAVTWGSFDADTLAGATPDVLCNSPEELRRVLGLDPR